MKQIEMIKMKGSHKTKSFRLAGALMALIMIFAACYKDHGNYVYSVPERPVITHMDSIYEIFVGDSLIIEPEVKLDVAESELKFSWTIYVPPISPGDTDLHFQGKALRMAFGLGPKTFTGRYSIENTISGMKYFKDFTLIGKTAFSKGITVLSAIGDKSVLSFIKPDDAVQPYIFQAVNPGRELPSQPTQLLAVPIAYRSPIQNYWVFGKSGLNTGIQIDANSFKMTKTLSDNFFDAPDTLLHPQKIFYNSMGVISGVINGALYNGTTSTWNEAPTYGMFGQSAAGDYELSPEMVFDFSNAGGNYIGFDKNLRKFVRFNLYGDATYFGDNYVVKGDAFDPKNMGMDLVHLQQINGGLCYGYFKAASDSIYECRMKANFNGPFEITELQKRPFARQALITGKTLWQATANEIIFLSDGQKVYRYNPLNQEFTLLPVDLKGKPVTMLKLRDQDTLVVGTEGDLYFLDIRTGRNGSLLKHIGGIEGNIIDIVFRTE
ncbi:MAG TPA: PKD-like family lipoprotein [Arachidicoccus sp.]|nr:PKD-like family lipoprotein [Arachidicoccus sp.]